jgi:hypothetical protein
MAGSGDASRSLADNRIGRPTAASGNFAPFQGVTMSTNVQRNGPAEAAGFRLFRQSTFVRLFISPHAEPLTAAAA